MENMEFWIATVSDDDGLHWSEILWGDGLSPADARLEAWNAFPDLCLIEGQELQLHGPYICNRAAAQRFGAEKLHP